MSTDPPGDAERSGGADASSGDSRDGGRDGASAPAADASADGGAADGADAGSDDEGHAGAGYVHDPEAAGEATARPGDREFGWRGWVLVGLVVFSFLIAPALILWRPPGLPYWAALLALPMLPGILLGIAAVWATTR